MTILTRMLLAASLFATPVFATTPPAARATGAPGAIRVNDESLTARLANVPLGAVLREISRQSGIEIHVHGDLAGPVTADFRSVPLSEALRRLLRGHASVLVYAEPGGASPREPRLRAVHVFAAHGTGAPAVLGVGLLAEDGDPPIAPADGEEALSSLSSALEREADPWIRQTAARALGKTWSEAAVEPLARALRQDARPAVREAAAASLGETWADAAVAPLVEALLADASPAVRERSARALDTIGDPRAAWALERARRDEALEVRESAEAALRGLEDEADDEEGSE